VKRLNIKQPRKYENVITKYI